MGDWAESPITKDTNAKNSISRFMAYLYSEQHFQIQAIALDSLINAKSSSAENTKF
jgi:hypothetical protein